VGLCFFSTHKRGPLVKNPIAELLVSLGLALSGCGGSSDCKNACSKFSSCGLKSSGLSCDTNCNQGDCAECVDETSCGDLLLGRCESKCPGVSFTKK